MKGDIEKLIEEEQNLKQQLMETRKKIASEMVDGAICVSSEMAEYAREELGINKTVVIQNGSDPAMFSPSKKRANIFDHRKFIVIWAGSTEYIWQGSNIPYLDRRS